MDINFKPQGFSNKETDLFSLYMEDNSMELGFWENEACDYWLDHGDKKKASEELAKALKLSFETMLDDSKANCFIDGLARLSLAKIDWQQIAETLVDQAKP